MGQLQYPQRKEIKGPWILNQEDFENLDNIIEKIDSLLRESLNAEIKQEVYDDPENKNKKEDELQKEIDRAKNSYRYSRREKVIKLISTDGIALSDKTIKGILKDSALTNLKPKKIYINLFYSYNNQFTLQIPSGFSGELEYDIVCYDTKTSDEIKYELERWMEKRKPNKVLQTWSNYGEPISYVIFIPLIFLFFYFMQKSYTSYNEVLIKQSKTIIDIGIDSTNSNDALELLLKLQSGYVPKDFVPTEKPKNPIYIRLLALSSLLYLICRVKPKTTIGLGKRKFLYKFYKFWVIFVTITIPTFLVILPFWEMIVSWLY